MNNTNSCEPLFHVIKRGSASSSKGYTVAVRAIAIILGFVLCGVICSIIFKANFFSIFVEMFKGVFSTPRKIWTAVKDMCLLLCVGLALVPVFKMKFYNLGGNGQILIGALVTTACMFRLGGKLPDWAVNLIMIPAAILGGAIWAVIPAIFKAFFKTNESLFTLMMNYIALVLVNLCITVWVPNGSGSLPPIETGALPHIGSSYQHILTLIITVVLTVAMFIYLKWSKHGYELSVVGGSENTARYIGLNVKKVVIRTVALSGAICGIVGLLLAGAINHSVGENSHNNMGFTAIMVAWLAQFNPIAMIGTSFMITFVSRGMAQVQTAFRITNNSVVQIVTAIIYFCIIGCRFFISYKVVVRNGSFVKTRAFFAKISEFFVKVSQKISDAFAKIGAKISEFFKKIFGKLFKKFDKGDNE